MIAAETAKPISITKETRLKGMPIERSSRKTNSKRPDKASEAIQRNFDIIENSISPRDSKMNHSDEKIFERIDTEDAVVKRPTGAFTCLNLLIKTRFAAICAI